MYKHLKELFAKIKYSFLTRNVIASYLLCSLMQTLPPGIISKTWPHLINFLQTHTQKCKNNLNFTSIFVTCKQDCKVWKQNEKWRKRLKKWENKTKQRPNKVSDINCQLTSSLALASSCNVGHFWEKKLWQSFRSTCSPYS